MKKKLMGFAICALIVTSCSKQNIVENITDGDGQLRFAAGSAQQGTKAAELNNSTLQGNTITLYAYQEIGSTWSKWYDDVVTYADDKWEITSVRFRNENPTKYITYSSTASGALTAPTNFNDANFVATTGTFPKFTYTVAANSVVQEDLIAGITEVDANKTDITLGMRHILSQINFGTVGYTGANIQIQNIKIEGVKNVGVFTYNAANTYPIGEWTPNSGTVTYDYYNYGGLVADNPHPLVGATAVTGNKYIFGDGGNWGPGKNASTLYPVGTNGAWVRGDNVTTTTATLNNSLMLLPQDLTDGAKVTFEYKINDVDNGYVAGSASTWATGEFALNFSTGAASGTHYLGKWEQNYRYVYLIDFTDFLDGVALTFNVDVDTCPWENHNNDVEDDGIVDIMSAGQPSQVDMNAAAFVNGDTWYIATQSETDPTVLNPKKWAQVMRDETWDLSDYNFANIGSGQLFTISFENVIFNPAGSPAKTITLTLPTGYIPVAAAGITMTGTNPYVLSAGNKYVTATVTITNVSNYNSANALLAGITAITANATTIHYKGAGPIVLLGIQPTNITNVTTITLKFTRTVIPTVGVTVNGIWTWNSKTRTATWTKAIWNNLNATKSAVTGATAGAVIYCSDATITNLATLGEPTTATNSPVTVIFNNPAVRIAGATANGNWSYNAVTQTAIWTKNVIWIQLVAAQLAVTGATSGAVIYCSDVTITNLAILSEPLGGINSPVTVVFNKPASRIAGVTTNGSWSYNVATQTAIWTKN